MSNQVDACNTAVQNYIDKTDRYDADIEQWKSDSAAYQRYEARYKACMEMQNYPHAPNSNYNEYYLKYLREFTDWEFPTSECWNTTDNHHAHKLTHICVNEMKGHLNKWGNAGVMPPADWWYDSGTTELPLKWIMASDFKAAPVRETRALFCPLPMYWRHKSCKLTTAAAEEFAKKKVIAIHLPISDVDGGKNWAVLGKPAQPQSPGTANILCCGITFDNLTATELSIDNITQNCQQTVVENKTVTKTDVGGGSIQANTTSGETIDIPLTAEEEDNTMTYGIIAFIVVCLLFLSSLMSFAVAFFLL
jgi:hypothetical protein